MTGEIFNEENSIIVTSAQKMVSLGSQAAQRILAGKEAKTQDAQADAILKLLTVYRRRADLSQDQLASILYDLRQLSEGNVFPTVNPIVGQGLTYVLQTSSGVSTIQIQNNGAALPARAYLSFYDMLTAVDDGTKINVGMIHGTDGYIVKMVSGSPAWALNNLDGLSDVVITTPSLGQSITYDGANWVNSNSFWSLLNGGTLTGPNHITVSSTNSLLFDGASGKVWFGNTQIGTALNIFSVTTTYNGSSIANSILQSLFGAGLAGYAGFISNANTNTGAVTMVGSNTNGTQSVSIVVDLDNLYALGAGAYVQDLRTVTKGLEYLADYSSGFTARSLVDKGYVTGLTGATGAWKLASGGTLTGANTIIGTGTNTITFQFNALATTPVNGAGLWLQNSTAATLGNQQISPSIVWEGQGWGTTGGISQSVKFLNYVLPVQSTVPTGQWKLAFSVSGGGYADILTINSSTPGTAASGVYQFRAGTTNGYMAIQTGDATNLGALEWYNGSGSRIAYMGGGNGIINIVLSNTQLSISGGNVNIGPNSNQNLAKLYIQQAALSSSWIPSLRVDPGAHTNMTVSTEFFDNYFRGSTKTWAAAGSAWTQRFNYFEGSVITTGVPDNAYTVYIDPPTGGGTSKYALGVAGNVNLFDATNTAVVRINDRTAQYGGSALTVVGLSGGNIFTAYLSGGGSVSTFAINNNGTTSIGTSATLSASILNVTGKTTLFMMPLVSGWGPIFHVTGGSVTTLPTGTEYSAVVLNSAQSDLGFSSGASLSAGTRVVTWVAGSTVTTQRDIYIRGTQYIPASSTLGITNAYTMYVDAPTAGTGTTITNNWAAGFNGAVRILTGALLIGGTTLTTGSILADFQSTTLGVMMPRVTNIASVTTPVAGMIAYDAATNKFNFRENASWTQLGGGSGWAVIGSTTITGNTTQTGAFTNTFALNGIIITQNVIASTGNTPSLLITGGAHTLLTASEAIDLNINLARTVQFTGSTGFATQRAAVFQAPTYAFQSATGTITTSATVSITGAPVAGTNCAITNPYALRVESGATLLLGDFTVGVLGTNYFKITGTPGTGNWNFDYGGDGIFTLGSTTGAVTPKITTAVFSNAGSNTSLLITTGDATANNNNSGNIYLSTGAKNGTGKEGNISIFSTTGSFGAGEKVVFIANRTTAPSSNPAGGGIVYAESGALKYRGSSGTITTIAPA